MAILDKLFTFGKAIFNKDVYLGESGKIALGDHNAVDGNTVYESSEDYKEIFFSTIGYTSGTMTCPIEVDQLLKNTRKLVIRLLPDSNGRTFLPQYIQFYDPSNWISSNVKVGSPLSIYIVPVNNTINNPGATFNIPTNLYAASGVTIGIIVETDLNSLASISTSTVKKWSATSTDGNYIAARFTVGSNGSAITISYYSTESELITGGLLNIL